MFLREDILDKLRCSFCQEILSVTPILSNNSQNKNACAICEQNCVGDGWFRDLAYEAACSNIVFPCRYEKFGCRETFTPTEMKEHRGNCKYIPIKCPLLHQESTNFSGFYGQIPVCEVFNHFITHHINMILYEGETSIKLSFENDSTKRLDFLLMGRNKPMLVTVNENISLNIGLFYLNESQSQKELYSISFVSDGVTYTDELRLQPRFWKENASGFANAAIRLDSSNFQLKILPVVELIDEKSVNNVILNVFKCLTCNGFVAPPVRKLSGIITCHICLDKMNVFKTTVIDDSLTALASLTTFPCRFCFNIFEHSAINSHESNCIRRSLKCFKCTVVVSAQSLAGHLASAHNELLLERSLVEHAFLTSDSSRCKRYFIHEENIFELLTAINKNSIIWDVTPVIELFKDYSFSITIALNDDEIYFRQVCLKSPENWFSQTSLNVPLSFVKPFSKDGKIKYSLDIFKS